MPIVNPEPKPSETQIIKARGCVVTTSGDDQYVVWNPEIDSMHTVDHGRCDCQGYLRFNYCYHLTAVSFHKENLANLSAKDAIPELYDF